MDGAAARRSPSAGTAIRRRPGPARRAGSAIQPVRQTNCRSLRRLAVHDVGDWSDEEPHPANTLALRLAGSGVTRKVVERVTAVRDLLRAVSAGGGAQVVWDGELPGYGHLTGCQERRPSRGALTVALGG